MAHPERYDITPNPDDTAGTTLYKAAIRVLLSRAAVYWSDANAHVFSGQSQHRRDVAMGALLAGAAPLDHDPDLPLLVQRSNIGFNPYEAVENPLSRDHLYCAYVDLQEITQA